MAGEEEEEEEERGGEGERLEYDQAEKRRASTVSDTRGLVLTGRTVRRRLAAVGGGGGTGCFQERREKDVEVAEPVRISADP